MNIITWKNCSVSEQTILLSRKQTPSSSSDLTEVVGSVINDVKSSGDKALKRYTQQFDKVVLEELSITEKEWDAAETLDNRYQCAISLAYDNIYKIQALDKPLELSTTINGIRIEKVSRAIDCVGLYIPGGTAPLISTVLMLAIPAQIAGCKNIIMLTPPDQQGLIHPAILYAAKLCGIRSIFRAGGAQAIAAMAYGTETIPKVNKIFGPGNAYVMEAKRQVADDPNGAALDMPAGPSEVMVIADDQANPVFVAADLLAQAEHDGDAKCVLVTPNAQFAERVLDEVERQKVTLKRQDQLVPSIAAGLILVAPDTASCFEIANCYAPEHLILHLNNPRQYLLNVQSAGAVFLGPWSAEALGDYASGTNHVLPTAGHAKTYSGLSVRDFMTTIAVQEVSPSGFLALAPLVEALAELETLDGHQRSVMLRRELLEEKGS